MPAQRPCASFEPIPPDIDLHTLVEETPNFEYVSRISCNMIDHQGMDAFEKLVLLHVIIGGKPLVIEDFQHRLDQWTFTSQWLRDNHGNKFEKARNLSNKEDIQLSISHYLNNMAMLTNQWTRHNYKDPERQRIYLKDIDCPQVWHDKLKEHIPASVFYLNENTGEVGGPGAVNEPNPHGHGARLGRAIARAGDLMSCLPPQMRAENMMCYIGHEGTYTPAHREMCASLGQNIMVETSGSLDEDGKPAKPGSSIWFMTETKDRHLVSEYWLSTLGHDIEVESHFAQINAWKAAPFTTYIVEQKVGDFILIPPLAPHQVWNRGTRTMKAAWNRTTVETLEMALEEALPRARMVCRDEQYKNKAIVLFALQRYSGLLKQVEKQKQNASDPSIEAALSGSLKIRQLQKDFKRLFALYTKILLSEMLSPVAPTEKKGQYLPFDSNVTCSYCRCNIFNRFLTCTSCLVTLENGTEDTYDICLECYAMGRSCRCLSKYKWVEQFPWNDLVEKYELWRHQIIGFEGAITEKTPQPLDIVRKTLQKKTLAQVCQEQLLSRPWRGPTKPTPPDNEENEEDEIEVNDDGSLKKRRKKRRSEKWMKENFNCHICKHREVKWKLAFCECGLSYCYGSLFRAFDMMPLAIMEDPDWKCPRCRKICSCAACRKDPEMKPFEPNGTILGHDTKKFADPRSTESLVDFSHSNISWVKKAGDDHPHETRRLRRRQDEAAHAKSQIPSLDDGYTDEENSPDRRSPDEAGTGFSQQDIMPLDPQLLMGTDSRRPNTETSNYRRNHDLAKSLNGVHSSSPRTADKARTGGIRGPLPSVAAMLDGPPIQEQVEQGQLGSCESAMTVDMSGYRDHNNQPPTRFVAPAAIMIRQAREMEAAGISYQYPDPTLPRTDDAPLHHSEPLQYPRLTTQQEQRDTAAQHAGQKRKRHSEHAIVRSDMSPTSQNDANHQFQQAQLQKTLAEAKKNDRYIAAQAALTGRHLVLKLRIGTPELAHLENGQDRQRSLAVAGDGLDDKPEDTVIVRSDLPQSVISTVRTISRPQPNHKRRIRVEPDEDFSTRKSRDRRPSGPLPSIASNNRCSTLVYEDLSDNSGAEGSVIVNGVSAVTETSKDNQPRSRKLPAYLARRHQEDGDVSPVALPYEAPRRASRRHKSPSPVATIDVQRSSSGESESPIDNHTPINKTTFISKTKPQSRSTLRPSHTFNRSQSNTPDLSLLAAGQPSSLGNDTTPMQIDEIEETQQDKLLAQNWAAEEFNSFLSERPSTPIEHIGANHATSVVISKDQTKGVSDGVPAGSPPVPVHKTQGKAVKVVRAAKSISVRKTRTQTQRLSDGMDTDRLPPHSSSPSSPPAAVNGTTRGRKVVNAVVINARQAQAQPPPQPQVRIQTKANRPSSGMYIDVNGPSPASHSKMAKASHSNTAKTKGAEIEAGLSKANSGGDSILSRTGLAGKKVRIVSRSQFMAKNKEPALNERGRGRGEFVALNNDDH